MVTKLFKIFLILAVLLFSFISFSGKIYYFLHPYLGVPWAYVIDHGIILPFIFLFLLSYSLKRQNRERIKKILQQHTFYILLLFISSLIAHGLIIEYYFFAEDVSSILLPVNNNYSLFLFSSLNNGYPFLPFIFSFLIFKSTALGYNIISLFLYTFCVMSVYWLSYIISRKKNLALLAGLFFATTPSYIDMFSWQASVQGMSLVLALGMCSFIFLIYYQKFRSFLYFLLSVIFFASAIKIGFVRTAGLILPLTFLLLFPFYAPKSSIWKRILHGIPYLLIWLGFIYFRVGLTLFLVPFDATRQNVGAPAVAAPYFFALSYYIAHLFLPSDVARQFIPFIRDAPFYLTGLQYEMPSIISIIGISIVMGLLFAGFTALFIKNLRIKWYLIFSLSFIFGGLFYVPLLGTVPALEWLDRNFISNIPPYGPGSRYVFFSAIGVGMFLSVIVYLLTISRRPFIRRIWFILVVLFIVVSSLLSFSAHKRIAESISRPDKNFIDKFFTLVPINGKKKLVVPLSPKTNAIENNISGRNWLYGFYKENELLYIKDLDEAKKLINSGEYEPGNIYGFYHNPDTLSFKDISQPLRHILFSKEDASPKEIPFSKNQSKTTFSIIDTQWGKRNILSRGVLESKDLAMRILKEKNIKVAMSINISSYGNFPYSDITITNKKEIQQSVWSIIPENMPKIFSRMENVPPSFTLSSFNNQNIEDIPIANKKEMVTILKQRERLRSNMVITVSGKNIKDKRVNEKSLVDDFYTNDPIPTNNQTFYLSDNLPSNITLELPYAITLGRISMNTSRSYGEHRPTDLDVFVSYDGVIYQKAGSINNTIDLLWSPNNGKLLTIPLDSMQAKFIKIVVKKTTNNQSVMFDEIVIDDIFAMKYTMEQIQEYKDKAFQHIESQEFLNQLTEMKAYNIFPVVYACAEEDDWEKQKRDYSKIIPGVWNIDLFQRDSDKTRLDISIPVNCYGSILRKIIIYGPPFPIEMKIERAFIE